jgi:DNA repair exonuclease SbcCD ATPase subunit
MSDLKQLQAKLAEAENRLREMEDRMPAHSVRPWQMQDLEDAEEEVRLLKKQISELADAP